jgi:hypothetical protein
MLVILVQSPWEKKCWLRVFENTVLRKLFGPKKDEATANWSRTA